MESNFKFTEIGYNRFLYYWAKNGFKFYRITAFTNEFLGVFFLRLQPVKSAKIARKNGKRRIIPTTEKDEKEETYETRFYFNRKGQLSKTYPNWLPKEQRLKLFGENTILTHEKEERIYKKLSLIYDL